MCFLIALKTRPFGNSSNTQTKSIKLINKEKEAFRIYGAAFATAKGLVANTDALKYFYSTFMPSTVVLGGTIVESTTAPGLTGLEMWNCALKSFNAENCGSTLLIGDENNLGELADISVNLLKLYTEDPANPENMGMLVMLNGFGECMQKYFQLEQVAFNLSESNVYIDFLNRLDQSGGPVIIELSRVQELNARGWQNLNINEKTELTTGLGFQNTESFEFYATTNFDSMKNINNNYLQPNNIATLSDQQIIFNSANRYTLGELSRGPSPACLKAYHLARAACMGKAILELGLAWYGAKALLLDAATEGAGMVVSLGSSILVAWDLYDCLDDADADLKTCH
ncbi:MAG: hypothetical protein ACI7YS_02550 [Flavobacterium sp.]